MRTMMLSVLRAQNVQQFRNLLTDGDPIIIKTGRSNPEPIAVVMSYADYQETLRVVNDFIKPLRHPEGS